MDLHAEAQRTLRSLGVDSGDQPEGLAVRSPIDGSRIGALAVDDAASIAVKVEGAQRAFLR